MDHGKALYHIFNLGFFRSNLAVGSPTVFATEDAFTAVDVISLPFPSCRARSGWESYGRLGSEIVVAWEPWFDGAERQRWLMRK